MKSSRFTLALVLFSGVLGLSAASLRAGNTTYTAGTIVSIATENTSGNTILNQTAGLGLTYTGSTLLNDSGATISNDGSNFSNADALTNHGTILSGYDGDNGLQGASYFGNEGTLTNASDGVITNVDSDFFNGDLNPSATLTNAGAINNDGYFENDGTLTNASGGVINNQGYVENYAAVTNASGGAINNLDNATFDNDGTLTNALGGVITNDDSTFNNGDYDAATFTNSGVFNNQDDASFYNYSSTVSNTAGATINNNNSGFYNYGGTVTNNGAINNTNAGFINENGTVTNNGVINNTDNAYFENDDTMINNVGAVFTNDVTSEIYNDGYFENDGTLTNAGSVINMCEAEFDNTGTLTNAVSGTITNKDDSNFTSTGAITNNGAITNERESVFCDNGTMDNYGSFTNESMSTVYVNGILNNYGVISNLPSCEFDGTEFQVNGNGTFNNYGTFNNGTGIGNGDDAAEFDNDNAMTNELGGAVNNNYASFFNEDYFVNNGTFNNQNDAYLENDGSFYNESVLNNDGSSEIYNYNYFENDATLNNSGTLENQDDNEFLNQGTLTNGGEIVNTEDSWFVNGGALVNYGTITNQEESEFDNEGTLTNWGTINNNDWFAYFENDATLKNYGTINNGDGDSPNCFANDGTLINEAGGVINNTDAEFENDVPGTSALLVNAGTFNNVDDAEFVNGHNGILDNTGTFNNGGDGSYDEFNNCGTVNNTGTFNNYESFYNMSGGVVTNNGFFNNEDAMICNNGGSFTNNGTLLGGMFSNTNGGTFVNAGSANLSCFSQSANSTLVIVVNPQGANTLNVSGNTNLNGTLQVVYAPGVYSGSRNYTLVSDPNGVNGSFSNLLAPTTYAGGSDLSYDDLDRHVDLDVVGMEVSPSNDTIFSDLRNTVLQGAQDANNGTLQRLDGISGGLGVDLVDADGNTQTGAWEKNTGSLMQVASSGSQPGYQAKGGIVSAGMDQRWGNSVAGFSVSDGQTQVISTDGEMGTVDTPGLGLYGGLSLGSFVVDASAAYAYDSFSTTRPVASVDQTASTAYNGQQASGALQVGAPLGFGGVDFLPVVGAGYAWLGTDEFTENGAQYFNLNGATLNQNSLRPFAGLTAEKGFHVGGFSVSPDLKVGYSYETLTQEQGTAALNGSDFGLNGESPTRGELSAGGGFASKLSNSVSFIGSYSIVVPTGTLLEQTLSLGARASF